MMHRIRTIDAHAAGEPLRLVTEGFPIPVGRTMLEKRAWVKKHADHLRKALMWEPRGHLDMYGALLTEPVTRDADAGVLFMHNEGLSTMCGHGVIAVVTIALERGLLPAVRRPDQVGARLACRNGAGDRGVRGAGNPARVARVSFANVPSFVLRSRPADSTRAARDQGRRRVRRRVLRHRRQRGRGPSDRRGAPAGASAGGHGSQARGRIGAGHRPPGRARASRASTAPSSPARRPIRPPISAT